MDLEALSYFGQIVESGSFSAAARALGLPRQRVHRRVSALERDLGLRLLDRSTRALRLTPVGQQLRGHAARVLAEARAAQSTLRLAAERPSGTIRITTTPLFGELVVNPAMVAFLADYPETRVEALFSMQPEPLIERDLDLAIRFGPLADSTLLSRALGRTQLLACASPDYLASRGHPSELDDLHEHTILAFSTRPGDQYRWFGDAASPPIMLRPRLISTSERATLDACLAGGGIAQLPYVLCHEPIARGELVEVLAHRRLEPFPFHAVYASRIHGNVTLEAFLAAVEECLHKVPWCPAQRDK